MRLDHWPLIHAIQEDHLKTGSLFQFVSLQGPFCLERFKSAWTACRRRHSRLSAALSAEHLLPGEAGPTPILELDWSPERLIERPLSAPLSWYIHKEGPRTYLNLHVHHALLDARAAVLLLDELLRRMAGEILPEEPLPLEPPQHRALEFKASTPPEQAELQPWPLDELAPLESASPWLLQRSWGPVAPLLDRCRAEGVTINAALSAALLRASPPGQGLETAVDLRPWSEPPDPILCEMMMISSQPKHQESFWDQARACLKSFRAALAWRGGRGFVPRRSRRPLLEHLLLNRLRIAEEAGVFASSPSLSNLGVLPLAPSYGALRVKALNFSVNQRVAHFPLFVGATTLNEALSLSFSGTSPLLRDPEARVEALFEALGQAMFDGQSASSP